MMSPGTTPKAKFAPRSPRPPSALTGADESAFAFAEGVLKQAVAVVDAVIADVAFEGNRDPKVIALALLCRSTSNFQGALTMARSNQAVECRALARLCWENLFRIDQLRQHGAAFVKAMRSDESANRVSLGESSLKHLADSPEGQTIRGLIKRERVEFPKPNKLKVRDTAKGDIEKMYPAYAMLSHDAAHPSITALKRHYRPDHRIRLTVEIVPPFKPGERLATLDTACDAVLGACIAVSDMLGGTSQNDALRALWERFLRQGRHAAAER
jgi:hypothetical protein